MKSELNTLDLIADVVLSAFDGPSINKDTAAEKMFLLRQIITHAKEQTSSDQSGDKRPLNCRFRLQDAGKTYPRSSCEACGKTVATGLGTHCQYTSQERSE